MHSPEESWATTTIIKTPAAFGVFSPGLFDVSQVSRMLHLKLCVSMATRRSPDLLTRELLSSNGTYISSAVRQ